MNKKNRIKNKIRNGVCGAAMVTLFVGAAAIESNSKVASVAVIISLGILLWYSAANGYLD